MGLGAALVFVTFMQHRSEKGGFGRFSGICWFVAGPVAVMVTDANGRFPAASRIGLLLAGGIPERSSRVRVNGE